MITRLFKRKAVFAFLPFIFDEENPYDVIDPDKDKTAIANENKTGFERLWSMFEKQPYNKVHPGIAVISQTALVTFIVGGIYGGATSSRSTFISFIEQNEATQFLNQHDAKRRLNDKMFTSFMSGFTKMGIKVAFLCTTLTATYTFISVYRNKDSAWHYAPAGSIAGALYKFPLGPKGMISGGFFGGVFGSIYGAFKWMALTLSRMSEESLREMYANNQMEREESIIKARRSLYLYEEEKRIMETIQDYDKLPK